MHTTHPSLYFWALGDLHYRAQPAWQALHAPRMQEMFEDIQSVWQEEGRPDFCVSPGDLVQTGTPTNYALAIQEIARQMQGIPFYPGIGNHEYHPDSQEDTFHTAAEFSAAWHKPPRYAWTAGEQHEIICIMLDQPYPYGSGERKESKEVIFPAETLHFLDATLQEHESRRALIFAHCPLQDTVLDRDPARNLDDDSQDTFFFVNNSAEVRAILAKHANVTLYISGHTHSGWNSPQLLFTEDLGKHTITHLNLMSPWYTGRHAGARRDPETNELIYVPDKPDTLITFALSIYADKALIRARDHRAHQWLTNWEIPLR
ncbi:hypothetical protein EPA93_29745 [Ktedonosporobacter rubrisoli]|uniref:Calcineurin-like phosphoesterase domain-containing protein n=1 Tax=Ktedonosporobacter rubrisoli TaxID=2509675 RepID=A0A4V0YZJ5_KTERU|nr:metallophosphoesterase [Ktedonosporobacter rubrisoli]QBD79941.1 hypothetical protein EPA93_29745 [Ktedonosporobacter rubrisoli]